MKNERVMKLAKNLLLCICVAVFTGCASIVSKSQYLVTIDSKPSGATFTVKNKLGRKIQRGITPATITLTSSAGFFNPARYSLQFEKEGYFSTSSSLSSGIDGWYIGNVIFGGIIGFLLVDPATGAMWRLGDTTYVELSLNPNSKAMPLVEKTPIPPDKDGAESIGGELKQLKDLKESGILKEEEYEKKRKVLVEKL